jgi:hypothetical protein
MDGVATVLPSTNEGLLPLLCRKVLHMCACVQDKIIITSTKAAATEALLQYIDAAYLPAHYGGTMVDKNGDALCRQTICVPERPIPKQYYWQPSADTPKDSEFEKICVHARGEVVVQKIENACMHSTLMLFIRTQRAFVMSMYVLCDGKEEMFMPPFNVPGVDSPVVNSVTIPLYKPTPCTYEVRMANPNSWFRSVNVEFSSRVLNNNNP